MPDINNSHFPERKEPVVDNIVETPVKMSFKYDKFKLMSANREQSRGHIEALKQAFKDMGNLTLVQPILVNEKMEIIDGQHRFTAAKELGEPIYYTIRPGLGVHEARQMNILHRTWNTDDFAHSYADTGDNNYVQYLELREDFGFNHTITVAYIVGGENKGMFANFRNGDFKVEDKLQAEIRLTQLLEISEVLPFGRDKAFAYAYLKVIKVPGYSQARMLKKAKLYGEMLVRKFGVEAEYLRALEELYNYRQSEDARLRLY